MVLDAKEQKPLRKKLYVNHDVQRSLILRSIIHWYFYMSAILLTVVIVTVVRDPSQDAIRLLFKSVVYFSPAILASVLLLPLFIWDILKASNKVAGPILRLQNEMSRLSKGDVKELRFRNGDHWSEVADGFNALAAQLRTERLAHQALKSQLEQISEPVAG